MKIEIDKDIFEKIICNLSEMSCPSEVGLKEDDWACINCEECWKKALDVKMIKE